MAENNNNLKDFFNQIKNIAEKYEEKEKQELQGEKFNIFFALKLNKKE